MTTQRQRTAEGILLHTEEDFECMRKAGRLAAETLDMITDHVKPGITTEALDTICAEFIADHGAVAAPLGYRGFPKSTCISINHVVCHGIPDGRVLKETDILNIDVTVIVDGWHGDNSRMYVAGDKPPNRKAERLMEVTHEALMRGIAVAKPDNTVGDIGHTIQKYAEGEGYSVVRDFCGHGLGLTFHEAPSILHFGQAGTGAILRPGMFFTIEPMLNIGKPETKLLSDGWTAVTRDRTLSAQFEHTIGITEDGCEIFTLSPANKFYPTWEG
jgi:methionyl aminopeptidase